MGRWEMDHDAAGATATHESTRVPCEIVQCIATSIVRRGSRRACRAI